MHSSTPNTDGGEGNNSRCANNPPTQSGSKSSGTNNHIGSGKKRDLGKQRQDDWNKESDNESDDDGPDPPPPPPSPQGPTAKGEIIHRADVALTILIDNEDKGHFVRVITNAKVCCPVYIAWLLYHMY